MHEHVSQNSCPFINVSVARESPLRSMPVEQLNLATNPSEGFHGMEDSKDHNSANHQKQELITCTHFILYGCSQQEGSNTQGAGKNNALRTERGRLSKMGQVCDLPWPRGPSQFLRWVMSYMYLSGAAGKDFAVFPRCGVSGQINS